MEHSFINDNYMVKAGGRYATKISKDELKEIICDYIKKYAEDYDPADTAFEDFDCYLASLIYSGKFDKDIKYDFDCENFTTEADFKVDNTYVGFQTLDNGFTFLGFWAGGDWQEPVFGIFYYDGKKLRVYQPTRGNMVNRKSKAAFGDDEEADEEVMYEYGDNLIESADAMIDEIKTRIVIK